MSRNRSRTIPKPNSVGYTFSVQGTSQHGYAPDPSPLPYGGQVMGNVVESCTDEITPEFYTRRMKGEIINNPFLKTRTEISYSPPAWFEHTYYQPSGSWCAEHQAYHDLWTKHCGMWRPDMPGPWPDQTGVQRDAKREAVKSLAVTQAAANIDTSEMLALATAAESRKTVESMAAILFRVYRIARNLRKFNLRALRKELTPKEIAARYMEARYAVRPLIYDAYGVARAFEKARGYERRTFRGYATLKGEIAGTTIPDLDTMYGVKCTASSKVEYDVSCRAGFLCDVSITDLTVFGVDQLAETAWELVPFSFVVDWFANVGDWIAAHTPNAGVTQRASWATVRSLIRSSWTVSSPRSYVDALGYVKGKLTLPTHQHVKEELLLQRYVDPEISMFPEVRLNLDMFKLTDLGILLRNFAK